MFSQLGPLFKTTFRKAESNDARQAIPHEERDQGRSKKDERRPEDKTNALWEDSTSVSISALKTFLIDFLQTMPDATDSAPIVPAEITVSSSTPDTPINNPSARAAAAYQNMAQKTQSAAPASQKTDNKKFEPTADKLQSRELRDIHALIKDLDLLSDNGVEELYITRAESFLESLKNAATLAKSKI